MTRRKHGGKKKGGFLPLAAIPPIIGTIAGLQSIKPATKLKGTFLGKVPVLGTVLDGLSKIGFGDPSPSPAAYIHPASGIYVPAMKAGPPIRLDYHPPNMQEGLLSVPGSQGGRKRRNKRH